VQDDPAAERLHAVLQAGQASAPGQVGAAAGAVADRDAQEVTDDLCLDTDGRGAGSPGPAGHVFIVARRRPGVVAGQACRASSCRRRIW
jgi:hypothetical protein